MPRTLLESRSQRTGNGTGTAASACVHLMLIVVAAYATAASAPAKTPDDPPTELHWIRPAQPKLTLLTTRNIAAESGPSSAATVPHSLSLNIPVGIPDVSIPLAPVRQSDFTAGPGTLSSRYAEASPAMAADKVAYDFREVDRQVAAIAGVAPGYPASLKAAGIEGEVRAQFIVNEEGRADPRTLRILSSTNELFSEAVRRALPKMRFTPARIGAHAVAQMVQQAFVFRLDR